MKRKLILALLFFAGLAAGSYYIFLVQPKNCPLYTSVKNETIQCRPNLPEEQESIDEAFRLLKKRKDNEAMVIFEQVLTQTPDNQQALWGKAEVLRRKRDYPLAQELLNTILINNPAHCPSLISLSYIHYKNNNFKEALKLVRQVLADPCAAKENRALAYMMLGSINSGRSSKGKIFSKIRYGTQIKCYFLQAKKIDSGLPEICMGLGTFYLLAPKIVGGDIDKAIDELELAVKAAPDFATANARLAQAYKKKGDLDKFALYSGRARQLDPENEVLQELD